MLALARGDSRERPANFPMAFFEASTIPSVKTLPTLIPRCGACGLDKGCKSPKMPVSGEGRKGILIVAEAPGADEDEQGVQLVGVAGQYLRSVLRRFDVDLDRDCWKTNSLICRPHENRTPTSDEIDYCRPNLLNAIRDLQPRMIVPLGLPAVRSLLGPLWKEDVGTMTQWAGWQIPLQKWNCWVAPNYHPSYVKRSEEENNGSVVKIWFERYLENAMQLEGRPWDIVPDYASQVRVILDPDEAAAAIREIINRKCAVSFDYETDRLKPDVKEEAEIVCCGVCVGGTAAVAYPWVGEAIAATSELLRSPVPKIGANTKFESRWTLSKLEHGVNNWKWDTLLAAHHQDNREGITSVKFQAFVELGIEPWNTHIEPFLRAIDDTANGRNRIHEVDLRSLLIYCGLDALVEYKIAEKQKFRFDRYR